MERTKGESIKTYILVILIFLSFIQVGILWTYQGYGFPTAFFDNFFKSNYYTPSYDIKEYFKPYRIIVSKGFDEPRLILNPDSEVYYKLWSDIGSYLKDIFLDNKLLYEVEFTEEEWSELAVSKSFIFEFRTTFSQELMEGILNIQRTSNYTIEGMNKIAVLPFEDVNNNLSIYITDGINIYKYAPRIHQNGLSKRDFDIIINELSEKEDVKKYSVIKEFIPDRSKAPFDISLDIPVIVGGDKYEEISDIVAFLPEFLESNLPDKEIDLPRIADKVLGRGKNRFDYMIDSDKTIIFKNLNNIYRISADGILEYTNLYDVDDADTGKKIEALNKAVEFISNRNILNQGTDIYLSGIEHNKEKNYYTFTFDYQVNNKPVLIHDSEAEHILNNEKTILNAITIRANSKRVIYGHWILRNFEVSKENNIYNLGFEDLIVDTFETYTNLTRNDFSIKSIDIYYEVNKNVDQNNLKPVWIIRGKDDKYFIVPISEKRGI